MISHLYQQLRTVKPYRVEGRVRRCRGLLVTCDGLSGLATIGDVCRIMPTEHNLDGHSASGVPEVMAEVVGVDEAGVHLLPFADLRGLGFGAPVVLTSNLDRVAPARTWIGRVLDPLARPLDQGPPLSAGPRSYLVKGSPLPAHSRRPLGARLDLGVRALDLFTPCRRGQRLGIFAGAGVGKSTLMGMLARNSDADVLVVGLVGERGREVGSFLNEVLGERGRARSIVVVATSDMPAMLRRRAAQLTLACAEALRDEGLSVLCLMDSVTRYAMALREIHLAAGEPPTSKGYPPSVFAELPQLLERAGPGTGDGSITGLFSVLVEGDDLADPVADAVRGILDGHVILERDLADAGRFPAIDILKSLSRCTPEVYGAEERALVARARQLMKAYDEMAELIQLGAYRPGTDPLLDEAIRVRPDLEALLCQESHEVSRLADGLERLQAAVSPGGADGQATR